MQALSFASIANLHFLIPLLRYLCPGQRPRAGAGERIAYGAGVKGAFIDIEIIIERAGLRAASALCKLRACLTAPPFLF